jgi:hypothetical protein
MDPLVIFGAFFFAACVLGPIFGAESRQAFLRPERKPRPNIGAMRPLQWPPWDAERRDP